MIMKPTEEQLQAAHALYCGGVKVKEIEAKVGIHNAQLYRWMRARGNWTRREAEHKTYGRRECPVCHEALPKKAGGGRVLCGKPECSEAWWAAFHAKRREAARNRRRESGDIGCCPWCEAEVWGENVYCCVEHREKAHAARRKARQKEVQRLDKLGFSTAAIAVRLRIGTSAVRYRRRAEEFVRPMPAA